MIVPTNWPGSAFSKTWIGIAIELLKYGALSFTSSITTVTLALFLKKGLESSVAVTVKV